MKAGKPKGKSEHSGAGNTHSEKTSTPVSPAADTRRGKWLAVAVTLTGLSVIGALLLNFHLNQSERGRHSQNDSTRREFAGDREKNISMADADSGYIDSSLCAGCHAEIYRTFKQTGMGKSFFRPRAAMTIEDFGQRVFYHARSDRYYTMYQRDGKYYQRRHQIGFEGKETNAVEKEIHFVVGSGNHARTYLHQTEGGRITEFPVAWYSESGGYWAMNPGYDRPDHEDFRRTIAYECMFCHNGYPQVKPGSDSSGSQPIFGGKIPEGIDCQRCHGPGRNHVQVVQAKGASPDAIRRSVVNPARLDWKRQLEICMQCHLQTTSFRFPHSIGRYNRNVFSYRPGEPLADYILHLDHPAGAGYDDKFEIAHQAYRLRKSACFQRSGGSMTCTTCHNPHAVQRGEEAIERYVSVCERCHVQTLKKTIAAGKHTPSGQCLGCHMPKRRTEDVVHVVMTDHYIQRHKPARDLLAPLREQHDRPRYTGEVALYYPPKVQDPEDELYLAVAQVKQNTNLNGGIPRLERAIETHRPEHAEFYFELARAYGETGRLDRAIPFYEEALRRDPNFRPALHRLGVTLSRSGQLSRAAEVLESALKTGPQDATLLNDLALVYRQQGRAADAIALLQRAVRIDPDHPQAFNTLGGALSENGDRPGAERAFRDALRAQPDFAAAHSNLANLLAGSGDLKQAEYHFEKAIQSDPQYAAAHNALADVLAMKGETARAIGHYRRAIEINPGFAVAHFNLGSALAGQGKLSESRRHFQKALELKPDYYEAHLGLGHVLASERKVEAALTHLRKAAESPEPHIRQGALTSLQAIASGRPLR